MMLDKAADTASAQEAGDSAVVKSAGRVLHILGLFMEARRPLRLRDISRAANMPSSGSSVLVRSLVGLGYLTFDAVNRPYYPTYRVVGLGSWMEEGTPDSRVAGLTEQWRPLT